MLNPDYLQKISEGAEEIAAELHASILEKIVGRMMNRLGRGEDYLLTATDKWQIDTLQEAGYLLDDITAELARYTKRQEKEIKEAMEEAGVKALTYDDSVYKAAGLSPTPLLQSPYMIRLMQRNYEATVGEWKNYTRTTASEAQRLFIRETDRAYNEVMSGAVSYTEAVKNAVDAISENGVKVRYDSGWEDTIETATLRAVRTGTAQATGEIQLARMEEMDWDIILTSSHLGARVGDGGANAGNHSWWQGKFFSLSGKDDRFPPFSETGYGTIEGLCGVNCRHSFGPGDGEHNPFEQFDTEENRQAYELSQRQRTLERRIRKTKRQVQTMQKAVEGCADDRLKFELQNMLDRKSALLSKQNKAYKDFCKANDLKELRDRLRIAKWDRSQAAKSAAAARRYEKNH